MPHRIDAAVESVKATVRDPQPHRAAAETEHPHLLERDHAVLLVGQPRDARVKKRITVVRFSTHP